MGVEDAAKAGFSAVGVVNDFANPFLSLPF